MVFTLLLFSDGESNLRIFKSEAARDAALHIEALQRFTAAVETNTEEDWTTESVVSNPAEFIRDITYGDTDVYTESIILEG